MMRSSILIPLSLFLLVVAPRPVAAQQSLTEVLSFLLVNRTVPTGDFARDEQAAAATRDAISRFLRIELSTLPVSSPAGSFTYRLDPSLGTAVRVSESFGPFFVERTLTAGRRRGSFGLNYTHARFDNIDGRKLRTGTLVALAGRFAGEITPFDAETLTIRLQARTVTASGYAGVTDRLDIGAALPLVNMTMKGLRVDTYRGTALVQATASSSVTGIGDFVVRAKYRFLERGNTSFAAVGEARLPTGSTENLMGGGQLVVTPRALASFEYGRVAAHGNFGYAFGGDSGELDYAGAVTIVATSRLTIVGELLGRRLGNGGRLVDVVDPHPTLAGVETVRLSSISDATTRMNLVAGFRWNVATKCILSLNVLRPLTSAGLNAGWVPTVTFDYSPGG